MLSFMKFPALSALSIMTLPLLTGCSPPPPLDFSLNNVPITRDKVPYRLASVSVTEENRVDRPNGYGSLPPESTKLVSPLKDSIQDALNRSASFNYQSKNYAALDVKILGIKYALFGVNFPVTIYADYSLIDLGSGSPIYDRIVAGHGATPFDYSYFGVVRQRHSLVEAGKSSVRNFLLDLERTASLRQGIKAAGNDKTPID